MCGVGVGCDIGLVVFCCVWGTVAAAVAFVVVVRRSSTQSWGRSSRVGRAGVESNNRGSWVFAQPVLCEWRIAVVVAATTQSISVVMFIMRCNFSTKEKKPFLNSKCSSMLRAKPAPASRRRDGGVVQARRS